MRVIKKNGDILEMTVAEYKELFNIPDTINSNWKSYPIYTDPSTYPDYKITCSTWN